MYALLGLGAALAAWGLLRGLEETRLRWWAIYAGAATVTLYAHNLGAFVLLALHALVAFRSRWRRHLPRLALADLLILLLFSPWLVMVLPGQIGFVERGYWLSSPDLDEVVRAVMLPVLTFYEPAPLWLLGIGLLTSLLILAFLALRAWRSRSGVGGFLLLSWAPIVSLLLISSWRPIYLERALLPSALFYLVAVGWLLTQGGLPKIVRMGLAALLAVCSLGSLSVHYTYAGFPRPPFQEAAAHLHANVQPEDAVVHTNKLTYLPMHYYSPDVAGVFLADPSGSPQDTLARPTQEALDLFATSTITAAVGEANRVWLVVFPREMEEMEALGATSSAQRWLKNRFVKDSEKCFQALSLILYEGEDH